jgi:hypothetical protein
MKSNSMGQIVLHAHEGHQGYSPKIFAPHTQVTYSSTTTSMLGNVNSSPGCTGSTSPMSCIRTRRLATQLIISRSHWPSCVPGHSISRLDYSPPGCTGSTSLMPCIQTHLVTRLLIGRSHRLLSCAQSLRLATRLLVVWLRRLYCVYDMHQDATSRPSITRLQSHQ